MPRVGKNRSGGKFRPYYITLSPLANLSSTPLIVNRQERGRITIRFPVFVKLIKHF